MTMPRLSDDLTGPRDLRHCQACGMTPLLPEASSDLTAWLEHDDNDRPEPIAVVLCRSCAARLIEPHARLYRELDANEPVPGAMHLCVLCRHRDGLLCTNPAAMFNGGPAPGLKIEFDTPPQRGFIRCSRPRRSGPYVVYPAPPTRCSGREHVDPSTFHVVGE